VAIPTFYAASVLDLLTKVQSMLASNKTSGVPAGTPNQPNYRILSPRILPINEICTDDLARDRLDLAAEAGSEEMQALKVSLDQRGQRNPITVCRDSQNRYQLISGWRRLTALRQLAQEQSTCEPTITARLTGRGERRIDLYIDMVESNLLHQNLSFAELAQLALTASADPALQELGLGQIISELYGALPKMKRSYIRSFVCLLQTLGESLQFPKKVSRNQGVAVARRLTAAPETADDLRRNLKYCDNEILQAAVLAQYLTSFRARDTLPPTPERQLRIGQSQITGRRGESVIRADFDFARIETAVLSRAVRAFEQILQRG